MIRIFALSTQQESIYELHKWLKSKDLEIEHFYVDLNEGIKATADEFNLTVFPALVGFKDINGKNVITKFADGTDIDKMSDDMVAKIKAELTPAE